jgi:transcriptional regulator with XRE-family HTH domain
MRSDMSPGADLLARKIREEITTRNLSAYEVAKRAGLDPAIVQRFLSGARSDLFLSTASRLLVALSGRLVFPAASRPRAPKPKPASFVPALEPAQS